MIPVFIYIIIYSILNIVQQIVSYVLYVFLGYSSVYDDPDEHVMTTMMMTQKRSAHVMLFQFDDDY